MTNGWIHPRTDDSSQPLVDFVWGNMPMQPSDDRVWQENWTLAADDSHAISFTEWNGYPGNQPNAGRTLVDGDPYIYWPAIGLCYTGSIKENRLDTVVKELIACGANPDWLTPAKFVGGTSWHDYNGGEYDENSGRIFYYYNAPTDTFGNDWQTNKPIYGTDMNDIVIYGWNTPNNTVSLNDKNSFTLVVLQSHTPNLHTADWLE